jgi:phosphorylated CTD-interacting factor 1
MNSIEGTKGYNAALPKSVFQLLKDQISVTGECFSSSCNATCPEFYTNNYDIERFFGSSGNFFDSNLTSGSYEANPPFIEELEYLMYQKMDQFLTTAEETDQPLSFFITIPEWSDSHPWICLISSKYLRYHCILEKGQHSYLKGNPHEKPARLSKVTINTGVFLLQSTMGMLEWPGQRLFELLPAAFA